MTTLAGVFGAVAEVVGASADALNRLDGQAGDGDLGVTMRTASSIVLELLPELDQMPLSDALRACGIRIARGAPSTAGTLVATGLLRAAKEADVLRSDSPAASLAALLDAACRGVAERGGAQVGSKTLLDALAPAVAVARARADAGGTVAEALSDAADAADAGARATASMRAVHGRAGWLAERSAGHEDAGARLVAIAFHAASNAVNGSAASAEARAKTRQP